MGRYLKLFMAFARNCLRQAAEFRANFWASLMTSLGWVIALLALLILIYHNTDTVAGWTKAEMFTLFGTYTILRGISNLLFYKNLSQLPTYIRTGTMDWILTKPVNSQFFVSLRYLELEDIGQSIGGVVIIIAGVTQVHLANPPSILTVLEFCTMLVCSISLFYSLTMILMTLSFWLVRIDNLMVLTDTVFQVARTPTDIFGAFGPLPRYILTYILPLGLIAALPVKALFGVMNSLHILLISLLVSAVFFTISVVFWNYAIRNYSSASS